MSIEDTIIEFLLSRGRRSSSTTEWYKHRLKHFADWCDEQGITDNDLVRAVEIRRYQESRSKVINPNTGKPLSTRTLHGEVVAVKTFFSFCHTEEIIANNPGRRIHAPKVDQTVIEVFTADQIRALLQAAEKEPYPVLVQRDRAIVCVLIDTVIRASELCGLTLNQVFLDRYDAYIKVMGKGRKEREVGLGDKSRAALNKYIRRYCEANSKEQHVFLSRTREPLTRNGLGQIISRLGEWAHVTGVRRGGEMVLVFQSVAPLIFLY